MTIDIQRTVNLDAPIVPETLRGALYQTEQMAHRFVITAMKGGATVNLTGAAISGLVMLADGETKELLPSAPTPQAGVTADGEAWVQFGAGCYTVPGRFGLTVFVTQGGATTCIYACVGTISRTTDGSPTVPEGTIPTAAELAEMIAQVQSAIQTIPTAVIYGSAQTLTDAQKTQARTNIGAASDEEVSDLKSALNSVTEVVHSPNVLDPDSIIEGYQIYSTIDGKLYANANMYTSAFIPVKAGDVIRRYRRLTEATYYGPGACVFEGIAEYTDADESTWTRGQGTVNPYTVQADGYIRFYNRLSQLSSDYITAVTINKEFTSASEIVEYYVKTYPIDTPKTEKNTLDITGLKSQVAVLEDITPTDKNKFVTTFIKFPMLSGVRTDIYFDNLMYGKFPMYMGAGIGNYAFTKHRDSVSITPGDSTSLTGGIVNFFASSACENNRIQNVGVNIQIVKTTDGSGKTKKVLLLGDSMTQAGKYQKFADDYFAEDGMTVTWLGSRTSSNGMKNEGRNGWRAYTYTHFAETTSGDGEGAATTNAFWNPTSQKFDFSYYMAQQEYDGVDIVFINLGTNDFTRGNHNTASDVLSAWQEIITSIHAYDADIQIVLWLCPLPCLMNGVNSSSARNTYVMHDILWSNYRGSAWGNNNIWVLPAFLCLDPVYGFPYESAQRNQYDTTTRNEPTDEVHPSDSGYHQIANPIIAMIKYIAAQDE